MASFTIRMVLHDATWEDYTSLAKEMEKVGYIDVIEAADGTRYKLPDAEYTGQAADKETALAEASAAAKVVGRKFSVLVTTSNGRKWTGLTVV